MELNEKIRRAMWICWLRLVLFVYLYNMVLKNIKRGKRCVCGENVEYTRMDKYITHTKIIKGTTAPPNIKQKVLYMYDQGERKKLPMIINIHHNVPYHENLPFVPPLLQSQMKIDRLFRLIVRIVASTTPLHRDHDLNKQPQIANGTSFILKTFWVVFPWYSHTHKVR